MKRFISFFIVFLSFSINAQENQQTVDQKINQSFHNATSWFTDTILYQIPITDNISIPWVLIILVGGATYFSIYFKGINFSGFTTAINVVRGKYDAIDKPENKSDIPETIKIEGEGEVSHFQALTAGPFRYCWIRKHCWCCYCIVYWRCWCYLLDDCCRTFRYGLKIC